MSYRDFPFPCFILATALMLYYEERLTLVSFYFLIFSSSHKNGQETPHSTLCREVQKVFWGLVAV